MAFGIIRVRNVHMNEVRLTEIHNGRQFAAEGIETPNHINKEAREHSHRTADEKLTTMECIEKRFSEVGIKPRKDSVVALEYVLTMSPEAMKTIDEAYDVSTLLSYFSWFINDKHGAENVISISKHYDESNPHVHVLVTPIVSKEVKWKNRNGQGSRLESRLCARDFTGDKDKLRQLQSDYFKYLNEDFPINLKQLFKIDLKRGVDARDRKAKNQFYSKMTNHVMGEVRGELFELEKKIKENKITLEEFKTQEAQLKSKITGISDGIERKKEKDKEIYVKNEKWAKNSPKTNLD